VSVRAMPILFASDVRERLRVRGLTFATAQATVSLRKFDRRVKNRQASSLEFRNALSAAVRGNGRIFTEANSFGANKARRVSADCFQAASEGSKFIFERRCAGVASK